MRYGRRLGIDVGKARIGLAISDQSGLLASPLATVLREVSLVASARKVLELCGDYSILEAYIGLPLALSGQVTASTSDALDFARVLAQESEFDILLIDERLTTVSAAANLRKQGISSKKGRKIIDQEAAALILENALNQEKLTGQTPGRAISEFQ